MRNGYNPHQSGLLKANGLIKWRRQQQWKTKNGIPNLNLSDSYNIKREIPSYDPSLKYSKRELILLAEKILLDDPKPPYETPAWLPADAYLRRIKREVYTARGTPDPSIVEGLYWRTHPNGRGVNSNRVPGRRGFYK